ncbi:MAG TPA: DUF262 domain-containing protein [Chloroflexota bacterium]|nr:DUF262 domain-containing protein [Chloroflexota bacterium]
MRADEARLGGLLEGQRQYVVPYFQRSYSWTRPQWATLNEDIAELFDSDSHHPHFLGSVVLLAESGAAASGHSILLIDGQQRLVTLCIFLAALRDLDPAAELAQRLGVSLTLGPDAEPRVLCTYQDRAAFAAIVSGAHELVPGAMTDAYHLFLASLKERGTDRAQAERFAGILLTRLSFVAITLDAEDNPYRIFESLNAKGMPLTQGDLLRNYFFMRLPPAEHEHWHRTVWTPMQGLLGPRLDDFMRDFLAKDGEPVRADEVYQAWRKRLGPLSEEGVRELLRQLSEWSADYDRVLHPSREPDPAVRRRMERLTTWSSTLLHPFHPFLLRLRADFARGKLDGAAFECLLLAAESYLVRRLFTSPPAVDEGRLFIELYAESAAAPDVATAFANGLRRPRQGWPEDEEFRAGMAKYPLYLGSHPDHRTLILQALEESYPHRIAPSWTHYVVEFVAPLLPRPDWLAEMQVTEDAYWRLVTTLANFTWAARDHSPSIRVAERKRDIAKVARGGLELARDIAHTERWTAEALAERGRRLADRAVDIWPRASGGAPG